MWIVRLALRRPYTFVVMSMLVAILGVFTIIKTPKDIFPDIDIPVISVIFNYSGMSPDEMDQRIVTPFERFLVTVVNDIDHTESQSLNGVAVIKIYFQKGAKIEAATAQVTAVGQTSIRVMPPGTQPPLIIRYSASNVPILQLSISSETIPEQQLFDLAINALRPELITIPGVQIPYPYGGRQRQVMVDLDPEKLYAFGISPADVSAALNNQNLILPAGTAKMGKQEFPIRLNSSPEKVAALNNLPIKTVKGTTIYIRDVAHVRDGFQVQTNVVHASDARGEMHRGVLLSILKNGGASTLDVVNAVKAKLPEVKKGLPPDLVVAELFDQSVFVRASVEGVIKEAAIAAGLTALMILLFLGSWRSTLIVVISIPLSILVAIIILSALGETLNTMTLGGMALAVGILVDDATVEIENIHRNLGQRKRLVRAILDGAQQIAVPAFVSTLCICIVFVPVVFISGAAKFLFTPLAMSVVFAMMTSYVLSRTLVPTMVHYLLATEVEMYGGELDPDDPHAQQAIHDREAHGPGGANGHDGQDGRAARDGGEPAGFLAGVRRALGRRAARVGLIVAALVAVAVVTLLTTPVGGHLPLVGPHFPAARHWLATHWPTLLFYAALAVGAWLVLWFIGRFNLIWRVHESFNRQFEKLRRGYGGLLSWCLDHRRALVVAFLTLVVISLAMFPLTGTDFFPGVDAGQLRLHVRVPPGRRIEKTEEYFGQVERVVRRIIPKEEIETVIDNIGIPNSGINLSLSDGSMCSPSDGEILVALRPEHRPTDEYVHALRRELAKEFPDFTFFFSPADIATQVLNFGLAAPIDIQVAGPVRYAKANQALAQEIRDEIATIPGVVDARLFQVPNTPDIRVRIDRTLADQLGVTQKDVANDLLISLSSSNQTAPNYWLNPANAVNYNILVQTPQYRINSLNALENTPIVPTIGGRTLLEGTQLLGNLATITRGVSASNSTHFDIKPTFDVMLNVAGADLGSVAKAVREVVDKHRPELQGNSSIALHGQVQSMQASFAGLAYGLVFAVVLVYLLMVINFQSWLDPLIILMALPGAMSGIIWMLFATHTTTSVPALMGAIMSIGVATANSILMITFANDQRVGEEGREPMNARDAALAAGLTRLRPVMMTALAMIIGMLPMSLGMSEGGEQNAPLGRAVIGGLLLATFATLFFVPVVYSVLRRQAPRTHVEPELRDEPALPARVPAHAGAAGDAANAPAVAAMS